MTLHPSYTEWSLHGSGGVQFDAYLFSRKERFPGRNPGARGAPLFVGHDGEAMTRSAVQYTIAKLYRRAGRGAQKPAGALVHALRHTFATQALETGADVVEVQELLGHASLNTTRRYLETTVAQLRGVGPGTSGPDRPARLQRGRKNQTR